jgi:hypothetical protein
MASYYMNEAAFELPEAGFVDETTHALESTLPSGGKLGVFVHRRRVDPGLTLRAAVDEHIALNDTRLALYEVVDQQPVAAGGVPAIALRARYRLGGVTFEHRQLYLVRGGQRMIFAVSAPVDEVEARDEAFDALVASLAFRADPA